jgi:hypothetical protein
MAWQAYVASARWVFADDPRTPPFSGKGIPPGSIIILDTVTEAPQATAQGTISGVASLTGPQTTALANSQGVLNRAFVVQALGLT